MSDPADGTPGDGADSREGAEPRDGADSQPRDGAQSGDGSASGSDAEARDEIAADASAPQSGLRNPAAALRGVGAATLAIEALVLLLAIQPLRVLGGHLSGPGVGVLVALAVLCCVLAGLLRRRWAWFAVLVLQLLVIGTGVLQWALIVIGLGFASIWLYVLHLRSTILGRI